MNIFDWAFLAIVVLCVPISVYAWSGAIRQFRKVMETRRQLKEMEHLKRIVAEWRRERYRAPIIQVGTLVNGLPMQDWVFYMPPGEFVTIQTHDPITQEIVIFGYSPSELAEIAQTPSEFECPELVDWPASE